MNLPKEIEAEWNLYKDLRNSGLKKKANKTLLDVVEKIENKGSEYFKEFLFTMCENGLSRNCVNKIQHPLFVRCILPLLVDGVKNSSATEIIYVVRANASGFGREIYNCLGDISNRQLLKNALENEPENVTVKNMLLDDYLEDLYFWAHHLPDTLITDLKTAQDVIRESAEFIVKNRDVISNELVENHKYYSELYSDYAKWSSGSHTYNFAVWCEKNKRKYSWVKSYYYE